MPQMAPISWLTLFILFFIIFIMFNMMNYFNYLPKSPSHQKETFKKNHLIWKW